MVAGWHREALALWPASIPVLMALAVCDPPREIPLPGLSKEEVEAGRQLLRSAERAGRVGTAGWDGDVLRAWPFREESALWLRGGWIAQAVWEALGGQDSCVAAWAAAMAMPSWGWSCRSGPVAASCWCGQRGACGWRGQRSWAGQPMSWAYGRGWDWRWCRGLGLVACHRCSVALWWR
jgi:hypothetical protein